MDIESVNGCLKSPEIHKEPVYYYKGLFKIHEVKILAKEEYTYSSYSWPVNYYRYLIEFPNGKKKYVHEGKIIEGKKNIYEF